MKKIRIVQTCLIVSNLCLSFFAQANSNSGRWYQVEMIVFKNHAVKSVNPEQFDISVLPASPNTVETLAASQAKSISFLDLDFRLLSQPDLDLQQLINEEQLTYDQVIQFFSNTHDTQNLLPKPYLILTPELSNLELQEHAENFKRNRNMEVIEYLAWQQPIFDSEVYTPIELNFGKQFGSQYEISGWLHLTISRYIQVNPQLYINEFTEIKQQEFNDLNFDKNQSQLASFNTHMFGKTLPYRLTSSIEVNETKQTASKQVLYIDHPELAFLFYFTPLDFNFEQ
ncbi:CsiV family protein [Marinicellulosiphila megalodicopiae]|uniref:CsiV family protein n=1 Tax=Marinicellulosiphila megalodicopiae TaxID=2724896 RepID=UPI003BB19885